MFLSYIQSEYYFGHSSFIPGQMGAKIRISAPVSDFREVIKQAEKIKERKPIKLKNNNIEEEKKDWLVRRSVEMKKKSQNNDEYFFDNENLLDLNMQSNEVRNVRTTTIMFFD